MVLNAQTEEFVEQDSDEYTAPVQRGSAAHLATHVLSVSRNTVRNPFIRLHTDDVEITRSGRDDVGLRHGGPNGCHLEPSLHASNQLRAREQWPVTEIPQNTENNHPVCKRHQVRGGTRHHQIPQ